MQWRWWDELGELLVRTQQGTSIRNGLCRWALQVDPADGPGREDPAGGP